MNRFPLDLVPSFVSPIVVERTAWLLLHSLWQFAIVAVVALLAEQLMRPVNAPTNLRLEAASVVLDEFQINLSNDEPSPVQGNQNN